MNNIVVIVVLFLVMIAMSAAQSLTPPYPVDPRGSSGRPIALRFDGAFMLINITFNCGPAGFCAGAWVNNGRGIVGTQSYVSHL